MTEETLEMPRNLVGGGTEESDAEQAQLADEEAEREWRAHNLPAEKLTLRWKYANKEIQLYERRLRSLRAYNVGPAVQAWVRSRLEWVRDNKLYERPDGVIVLEIDPQGDVDLRLEEACEPPQFCADDLCFEDGVLRGCTLAATLWAIGERDICAVDAGKAGIRDAADTLVRDLAKTLGFEQVEGKIAQEQLVDWELFAANDEFGVIPCEEHGGAAVAKMAACFERLWNK